MSITIVNGWGSKRALSEEELREALTILTLMREQMAGQVVLPKQMWAMDKLGQKRDWWEEAVDCLCLEGVACRTIRHYIGPARVSSDEDLRYVINYLLVLRIWGSSPTFDGITHYEDRLQSQVEDYNDRTAVGVTDVVELIDNTIDYVEEALDESTS